MVVATLATSFATSFATQLVRHAIWGATHRCVGRRLVVLLVVVLLVRAVRWRSTTTSFSLHIRRPAGVVWSARASVLWHVHHLLAVTCLTIPT